VLRICSIALSNRRVPPGLVTASMSIGMCGEYFEERGEQETLLGVPEELEVEQGWPTKPTASALRGLLGVVRFMGFERFLLL
jgi:hypothetical protein